MGAVRSARASGAFGPSRFAPMDEGGAASSIGASAGAPEPASTPRLDEGGDSEGAPALVRVRLDLAYDGTDFHGWAAQPGLRTVQGEIEAALALVARAPLSLTVAGRTDAGVHARHQVAHVDVPAARWAALAPRGGDPSDDAALGQALVRRLGGLLARAHGEWGRAHGLEIPQGSSDVVVSRARRVSPDFDARFSALGRRYCYRLTDSAPDPLRRRDVLAVAGPLDLDAMNEAGRSLLGEHDFLSFCRPREGATTIRTLTRLEFARVDGLIEVRVEADAFCHSMVRSLIGALLRIGAGRKAASWALELLDRRSREGAAPIAPARGLSLEGVDYPPEEEWASRARTSRRRRDCCGE